MPNIRFVANAQRKAQQEKYEFSDFEPGDEITFKINEKTLTVEAVDSGDGTVSISDLINSAVTAWGESTIPEFTEIEAAAGDDDEDGISEYLLLTARTAGKPFTVSVVAGNGAGFQVNVTTVTQGVANTNEKQQIRLPAATSGGTFTLTFAGQTTGALAFNAPATGLGSIQEALEALSNIAPGDVTVTGSAGGPWVVEFTGTYAGTNIPLITGDGTSLTGAATVTVATTTDGKPGQNQIDDVTFTLSESSAGPEWSVTVNGTKSNTSYNEPNATHLKTLIEEIVGVGNVLTSQITTLKFRVEFVGSYGSQFVLITVQSSGRYTASTFQIKAGSETGTNEVQAVKVNDGPKAGTFTLTFEGQTTGTVAYDADQYTVRDALCDLSNIAGTDEVQTLSISGGPTGGSFTLTYDGQTTGAIAFDATAAAVQTALEGLSNVGVGDIVCTGGPLPGTAVTMTFRKALGRKAVVLITATNSLTGGTSPAISIVETTAGVDADVIVTKSGTLPNIATYAVAFQNALANLDLQQMTANSSGLTGGNVYCDTIQTAIAGADEAQRVSISQQANSGTFTLTFNGQTTAGIAYNASAATVEAALELLSNIDDVAVVGDAGGPWTIEFKGTNAKANVAQMTGTSVDLAGSGSQTATKTIIITSSGPNHANVLHNWLNVDTGVYALPVAGDNVFIDQGEEGLLYELETFSGATWAELHITMGHTGGIGLPEVNDDNETTYYEYRPRYLKVGVTSLFIGNGEGAGSGLINLDLQAVQTTANIQNSGQPGIDGKKTINIRATHISNVFNIQKGSVAISPESGDSSTILTLRQGFVDNPTDDTDVFCGKGATIGTVEKSGGRTQINSAVGTQFNQLDGTTDFNGAGAMAQLQVRGGTFNYNSTGALNGNTIVSGTGHLDFSRDMRPKTVTNPIERYGDESRVTDPHKAITPLVVDSNEADNLSNLNLGRNVRITRGTPA